MDFSEKVVVVTGAGRGIGREVAIAYAKQGAQVIVADRNEEGARETVRRIEELRGRAEWARVDVAKPNEVVTLMEHIDEAYGQLDILINNAGVSFWKSPYEISLEEWDDVININLRGSFLCAREAAKIMRKHQKGAIVNIASTRALMSEPNSEAYAASKGGILSLTHALAVSLGPDGIRVNAISPGWIELGDYDALRKADHEQHPAGRVGTPGDIARACLFLTDNGNDFITGTNMVVDGGMTRKMLYIE